MAVPLTDATAIQLADGTWYTLTANSLGVVIDPSFTDPTSGALVTPGDAWVQWVDSTGQAYAAPFRGVLAVKLGAPVT